MENSKTTGWKHKSTNKLSEKQQSKVGKVMHEFKEGELHSGSKKGPIVKDRDQAIAIALSEAKSMDKMSKGGGIKVGDVWEWHGVEYDPKKGDNYKVVKQVEIIDIDSKGQVKGRYVGTTKNFIVREPNKYLKKKVTDKMKKGALLTPLDVKDGDIFKTIDGDTIQLSIINSYKDGKYYILRHHPLNNSKPENTLLPFEFDRYYKAGLYEKVDPISLIKNENKMVRGGYTNPGYDVKTTGVYLFKTKKGSFNVVSYLFERENDTEDSLEIQDDLRGNLGSILIQNSAWKRLSSGKPVKARSAYGDYIGTLTRIDDTKNVSKYTSGTYNDYAFKDGGGIGHDKIKTSKDEDGNSIGKYLDLNFKIYNLKEGWSYDIYYYSPIMEQQKTYSSDKDHASFRTKKSAIDSLKETIEDIKESNDKFTKSREERNEKFKGGGGVDSKREYLEKRLWNERGYERDYLNKLSSKELRSLYDTEFYYDEEFKEGGGLNDNNEIKSTEELINLVSKEREKYIKEWRKKGEKVVVGRNDGYWWQLPNERDTMTDLARNPSKRKIQQIIKEYPGVTEIHFNGSIKVAERVGWEMEIVDDFDVLLWSKKDISNKKELSNNIDNKEELLIELNKLQDDVNSPRLSNIREGVTSYKAEKARKERYKKLGRISEILLELRRDNNKYEGGGTIEVGDKVKASKEYGGKSGRVVDKMGSFVVVEYSNGQSDSYHESDLIKKMETGGELDKMSLTQLLDKVPIFEQMHIEGYSEYTKAKMAYDDFNKETGNKHLSFEEKRIYDNFSQRRLKALSKYKENVIKYLQSNKVNKKMSGGKLNDLIEDIKAFDNNIYPKNSDVSYKNRLIIAYFKTKGYSIIEISKALKIVRNS